MEFKGEQFSEYSLYIGYNNQKEGFEFPVLPDVITVEGGSNSKTYNIVGNITTGSDPQSGEVNVIKGPKLRTVSWTSIFPAQSGPYVATKHLFQPMQYVQDIDRWMKTRHPVRFIFAGYYKASMVGKKKEENYTDINIAASIESFTWKESGGSPGDLEYSITLKEYMFYKARKVELKTDPVTQKTTIVKSPPPREDDRIRPLTYTMVPGDSLISISKKLLGTSARYREIQHLNGISDDLLTKLQVGAVLKIPQGGPPAQPLRRTFSQTSAPMSGEELMAAALQPGGAAWAVPLPPLNPTVIPRRGGDFSGDLEFTDGGSSGGSSSSRGVFGDRPTSSSRGGW